MFLWDADELDAGLTGVGSGGRGRGGRVDTVEPARLGGRQ